jgi:hypothetical protein
MCNRRRKERAGNKFYRRNFSEIKKKKDGTFAVRVKKCTREGEIKRGSVCVCVCVWWSWGNGKSDTTALFRGGTQGDQCNAYSGMQTME